MTLYHDLARGDSSPSSGILHFMLYDTVLNQGSFTAGRWVRWSQYELVNGVVTPAPGAKLLEYDPWEGFRKNVGKYRTVEQPYVPLLELGRRLKETARDGITPTRLTGRTLAGPTVGPPTSADELILNWCNHHGLLGILPVLAIRIELRRAEVDETGPTVVIESVQYVRDGGHWETDVSIQHEHVSTLKETEARAREIEEGDEPTATYVHWFTHAYNEWSRDDLRDFFPRLSRDARTCVPPQPLTPEFWEVYGEPVWEIADSCTRFERIVGLMSEWTGGGVADPRYADVGRAFRALNGLAQIASSSFRFHVDQNRLQEERASPGLLASYPLMFLWDRQAGRRCLQCQNCSRYFVSNDSRARYCSPRCRNTVQGRRHRAKTSGRRERHGIDRPEEGR